MTEIIKKLEDLKGFNSIQQKLIAMFNALNIAQVTYQHPPIFTVEEGDNLGLHQHIPGQGGKSLFLKSKSGQFWLVVACDDTRTDLKALANTLDAKRLSFASAEKMVELMGVTPGSATPFALINDAQHQIRVVLDKKFLSASHCVFHPLENCYSTVITVNDLLRFLDYSGHTPLILPLEATETLP